MDELSSLRRMDSNIVIKMNNRISVIARSGATKQSDKRKISARNVLL